MCPSNAGVKSCPGPSRPHFSLVVSPFAVPSGGYFFPSEVERVTIQGYTFLFYAPYVFYGGFYVLTSTLYPSPPTWQTRWAPKTPFGTSASEPMSSTGRSGP